MGMTLAALGCVATATLSPKLSPWLSFVLLLGAAVPHVNFLGVFLSMLSLFASSLSSAMFLFPL